MSRRALAGLILCAFLLGLAWPLLSAVPAVPSQVLAGDVFVITQGSGRYSINASLAQNVSAQSWAQAVSPEIFAPGTLDGTAVVVRGVDPTDFLAVEGASASLPAALPASWALAGSGLASRLGLAAGTELTLVGSAVPRLDVVPLMGLFHSTTTSNDELLVDLATVRFLTGIPSPLYQTIRVRTSDPGALVAFLQQRGASAHVSGPSGNVGGANTGPLPTNPRIVNLFLRYGIGPLPADYLTEALAEATNSVQVVAWGLELLVALLVAVGIHAVQARAFEDRRATVGVLRALGAPARWVRLRAVGELLPLAALAGVVGSALGSLAAVLLTPNAAVVAFGHEVRVAFDPLGLLLAAGAVVLLAVASELVLLAPSLRERPSASLRRETTAGPPRSLEVVLRD